MRGAAVLALLDRAVAAAASVLAAAGVLCVIAMMLVVTNEVGSRYLLNAPSTWSDETASYLLIAIVFLGLAQTLRSSSHIRIDIVTNLVSSRTRLWLDLTAYGIGLVFSVMLLVGCWIRFHNFWVRNTISDAGSITLWIPMVPVVLGAAALVLAMSTGFISACRSAFGDRQGDTASRSVS